MGLDQYAYAVMPHRENSDFAWAWTRDDAGTVNEIAYWRKHSDLQGWMEALWLRKCEEQGVEPSVGEPGSWFEGQVNFNCQPLRLSHDDLLELRAAVNADALPHTTGFFFGESQPEDREDTLAFVEAALKAVSQDMEIYYDSWW